MNQDKVIQLRQQILHLKSELAYYKREVNRYRNDFHYSQIEDLLQDNKQLYLQLDDTKDDLILTKEKLYAIEEANVKLKEDMEAVLLFNHRYEETIKSLHDQRKELVDEKNTLLKKVEDLILHHSNLTKQINELEDHNYALKDELEEVKKEKQLVVHNESLVIEDLNYHKKIVEKGESDKKELQLQNKEAFQRIGKYEEQLESVKLQVKINNKTIQGLSDSNDKYKEQIQGLKQKNELITKENNRLIQQLSQKEDDIKELKSELTNASIEYNKKIETVENSYKQLETRFIELIGNAVGNEHELENLNSRVYGVEKENEKIYNTLQTHQKGMSDFKNRLVDLEEKIKETFSSMIKFRRTSNQKAETEVKR